MFAIRIPACRFWPTGLSHFRALRAAWIPSVSGLPETLEVGEGSSSLKQEDESVRPAMDKRMLPKTREDHRQATSGSFVQPEKPKFLSVAVIGMPNAGKSTLTNRLVGTKISAVSKKVHTTRRNVIGTLVQDSTQILFCDSPGLVTKSHCVKHNLEHTFITQSAQSAARADLIMAVVDASNPRERKALSPGVIEKLSLFPDKPSVLVLNKVDAVYRKRLLFDICCQLTAGKIEGQTVVPHMPQSLPHQQSPNDSQKIKSAEKRMRQKGYILELPKSRAEFAGVDVVDEDEEDAADFVPIAWPNFCHVFMVSALNGDGIGDIRDYLLSIARPGNWKFPADVITNQKPESLVLMTVREKLLEHLDRELPYVIRMKIQSWCVMRTGTLCVGVDLLVPKRRYVSQVLGEGGKSIARIADESRQELSNAFRSDVSLKLVVRCTDKPK